jgi:RimJ/RimL family protein N-acetyltransferase
MSRVYPDEVAGPYEAPPRAFEDREGREIEVARFAGSDLEALVEMYVAFDPEDRAQGIPPTGEDSVRDWLDAIAVDTGGVNVLAWHGDDVVGHATLVPDFDESGDDDAYELAIFVLREYQGAGIGSQLMAGLLGAGREDGVERVWLTVERWNSAAVALYEKVGFEPADTGSFELEMAAKLSD